MITTEHTEYTEKKRRPAMSFENPTFTPAEDICCTSVYDAGITIGNTTDVDVLRQALAYKKKHSTRKSMIRMIESRIRKLERTR